MSRLRAPILVGLCIVLLAGLLWRRSGQRRFASPDDCVRAYYEAAVSGDAATYFECLAESLQAATRQTYRDDEELQRYLRAAMAELKNWSQTATEQDASAAMVEIQETRLHGRRRLQYRLAEDAGGWRIVEIGAAEELPAIIPYGTHEKELLPK